MVVFAENEEAVPEAVADDCPICQGLPDWSRGQLCQRCEADMVAGLAYEAEQAQVVAASRRRAPDSEPGVSGT
jgi:hypothetical protein